MKKIVSAILVCALLLCSLLTFVACKGVDEGVYVSSSGTEIEFVKKTCTVNADGSQKTYTYEIKDDASNPDKQEIHLSADGETLVFSYEKLKDGVAIEGIKYNKQ